MSFLVFIASLIISSCSTTHEHMSGFFMQHIQVNELRTRPLVAFARGVMLATFATVCTWILGFDHNFHIYAAMPITPQAGRGPALPVFLLSSWPPFPRSSVPAWTTMVRCKWLVSIVSSMCVIQHTPRTLCSPMSLIKLSL